MSDRERIDRITAAIDRVTLLRQLVKEAEAELRDAVDEAETTEMYVGVSAGREARETRQG